MKKSILILSVIILFASGCGRTNCSSEQTAIKTQKENPIIENFQSEKLSEIKDKEEYRKLPEIKDIDLSKLLRKEINFMGMIGDDIQKMGIVFLSTTRISENEYEIIGKSKIKDNVRDFKGIMKVQDVLESDIDGGEVSTVDGMITGKYSFAQDTTQYGTGVFEGYFKIYWAYGKNDVISLADFWYTTSNYTILFEGSWKNYQTGETKNACWTDYKGCFPDDFDMSDGPDLVPSEKYRSSGWGDKIDMFTASDRETRKDAEKRFLENWVDWWK